MPNTARSASQQATRNGAVVAGAIVLMNLGTYGFNIVAAHLLGPSSFGAVAAALNVLMLLTVLQLGLQTVAARRISTDPENSAEVQHSILAVAHRLALGAAAVGLAAAPLVNELLRLESLPTALLVGLVAYPFTLTGAYAGILQGRRRWGWLALTYVGLGVPRLVLGVTMLAIRPTQFSVMVGVTIAAAVPLVVGMAGVRDTVRRTETTAHSGRHRPAHLTRETFRNCQALLAFLALSSCDLLVARNVLDAHDAGLYAAGALLAKAVLFLPQFVIVLAFPSMGHAHLHRGVLLRSLAVVGTLGAVAAVAAATLSDLALVFVGGEDYREMQPHLWKFALLGTALSLLQILIYGLLSQQARRRILLVWVAVVVLVVVGRTTTTPIELFTVVVALDVALVAVLLVLAFLPASDEPVEPVEPDVVPNSAT